MCPRQLPPRKGGARTHAVVIGASMGGLCAARVLADRFDRVSLLERDDVGASPQHRRGVPQSRHAHGLLPAGAMQLERWFPGLRDELRAAGAVVFDYGEVSWHHGGSYRRQLVSGIEVLMSSRPLLEHHVRARLLGLANVTLHSGVGVCGLTTDQRAVTGVRLEDGSTIEADLVVDASGRAARSVRWLEALGYEPPPTSAVTIDMGYATRVVRPDAGSQRRLVPAVAVPEPPSLRAGVAFPLETGDWMVTLGWWHGDRAPNDDEGYLAYARSLPNPRIAELLATAEAMSDVVTHHMPSNLRRHVERWRRVPGGLVLCGDAICSFNPIYGQGMTSAAWQAECLAAALDATPGTDGRFARAFYRRVANAVDTPWRISAGGDFTFAATTGPKPHGTDLVNRYMTKVFQAAHTSEVVCQRVIEVTALLRPPTSLLTPGMAMTVLRAAPRSPARRSQPHATAIPLTTPS
jgi:2-polyprenyl-6-methoxyphenol hydroxylase-like FAD-dependent oxidoreductase